MVTTAVVAGVSGLCASVVALAGGGGPSWRQLTVAGVLGILLAASWVRPLTIFHGEQSEAIHVDEYFFVVLVLLVPGALTVATFALATVVAQLVLRRPFVKSAFNVGQIVVSAGLGVSAYDFLAPAASTLDYGHVGAAVAATLVYLVVNTACVSAVLVASGLKCSEVIGDGLDVRLMLTVASLAVGLATAVIVHDRLPFVPLAVVPPTILRLVLADQFEARRDRVRVRGLFDATLAANRSMGEQDVAGSIVCSARQLLRCRDAFLTDDAEAPGDLRARLPLPGRHLWLVVAGRSRTEPFDASDQSLLDALAAVGTGALSNAWLYEEGRHQRERLAAITSSMGEGVCAVTRSGEITFINPAAAAMLGWHSEGAGLGYQAPAFVLGPARRAVATGSTVTSYDTRFERADGSFFHVAFTASPILQGDHASGAVIVFRDITERKQFEERLARHAFHDALTGLPNRRLFIDHLDHALRRAMRSKEHHAVLFADVDRFKIINDSLGHHAGDHLLAAIAERMQASLRPGDVLARFGGDEFTVLLEGVTGTRDAEVVAERILDQLRRPISLPDGHEVVASVSIGIALTVAGKTRDDLLHDADVAMYQTKGKGRGGQYEVFDADAMGARSAERVELEAALRKALERRELEVHYQPLFSVADRRIVGAEALVRWNHPERGMLGPASFIGLAEDTGLILPLGRQVLEDACHQARRWYETFGTRLVVGVNLSARQFQQAGLVEDIDSLLRSTGVEPSQLSLEITESLAMDDVERTREILVGLKALGVKVAIDDFGTGYSALGYLAHFPIDVVKVDRSFVEDVERDPVKSAIVAAVINLSEAIGTTAVVEGVETSEQFEHLRALGCPEVQGYHLARPMAAKELDALLYRELARTAPAAAAMTA